RLRARQIAEPRGGQRSVVVPARGRMRLEAFARDTERPVRGVRVSGKQRGRTERGDYPGVVAAVAVRRALECIVGFAVSAEPLEGDGHVMEDGRARGGKRGQLLIRLDRFRPFALTHEHERET